jgi:hypothetical protein
MRPNRGASRRICRYLILDERELLVKAGKIRLDVVFVPGNFVLPPAAFTDGFLVFPVTEGGL